MSILNHKHSNAGASAASRLRIGALPGQTDRGRIGIVSRSSELSALAARQLASFGLGACAIEQAGEKANGHAPSHLQRLQCFDEDPGTDAVLLIGAFDTAELDVCTAWIAQHMRKPLVAFIDETDPAHAQRARLRDCDARLVNDASQMGEAVASVVQPEWLPFD